MKINNTGSEKGCGRFLSFLLCFALAATLTLSLAPPASSYADGTPPTNVVLTNFQIFEPYSSANPSGDTYLPVTVSGDGGNGTVYTVNDTKGFDYETLTKSSTTPRIKFTPNSERVGIYHPDYPSSSVQHLPAAYNTDGIEIWRLFPEIESYNSDPDYVILKFSLYVIDTYSPDGSPGKYMPIDSTKSDYTIRLKKWEKQYQPEIKSRWFNTAMTIGEAASSSSWKPGYKQLSSRDFTPVQGQPHTYEYVVDAGVSLPYSRNVNVTPHYRTDAYFDGVYFYDTFAREITFTKNKQYHDFKLDPGTKYDTKQVKYAVTTWRLRVIPTGGSDGSGNNSGDGNLTGNPLSPSTQGTFKDSAGKSVSVIVSGIKDMTWTGKQIKPALTVKAAGKTLKSGTDYTVTYGANKNIGKGAATVKGKGGYSGTLKANFKIVPKKPAALKLKAGKKSLKITFNKLSKAQKITTYKVEYRVKGDKTWKSKTVKVKLNAKAKTASLTLKNLKSKKTYEVRAYAYKNSFKGYPSGVKRAKVK